MTIRKLVVLCVLAGAHTIFAQTFATLVNFDGTNGISPEAALVQGINGDLYGTTNSGGKHNVGTVFKMTPSGALTTLYMFHGAGSAVGDGSFPTSAPVLAINGNFYGTTSGGGASNNGTVYEITAAGRLTTIYSFCASGSPCNDGAVPFAGLVRGANGNFYGTTDRGANCSGLCGTVFTITAAGKLTTLHSFHKTDGQNPNGLVLGVDGNFYGTTQAGGASNAGTVFKITPGGKLTTLHSFSGYPDDGASPYGGLIQAADGNFYGTTYSGGSILDGAGTVYQITSGGAVTLLHSFTGGLDGGSPGAALIQGTDGNLYGTTQYGGANCGPPSGEGCGTIFEISTSGALTTLYNFCAVNDPASCTDGFGPFSSLFQATNGTFYGTTAMGGDSSDSAGTAYSLSTGLGPFVATVPVLGKAGQAVVILGTNLTGATSVTFNGTAATFTVKSPTAIKTSVPTGAATGAVQVVTPSGTLDSNAPFSVVQ